MTFPSTIIKLLSNVPFSNNYEHQMTFSDETAQQDYFNSKVSHTFLEFTYQREEQAVKVSKVYDALYNCNYLMFQNPDYNGKWFYAFITKKEYVNPNTTKIYFEVDPWQTYQFNLTFLPSFVEREHCQRWNTDGTPVINTVDEGLNYGTEYDNVSVSQFTPNDGYKWLVIVAKKQMHTGGTNKTTSTVLGTPTPLSIYLVPFKDNNTVPVVEIPNQGISGFSAQISKPTEVLDALYTLTDSVNNIVSLYVTDYTGIPCTVSNNVITIDNPNNDVQGVSVGTVNCLYVAQITQFANLIESLGNKYDGYNTVTESKLLMTPYTQLVLDDFKGNRAVFKNEYINNTDLNIVVKGSLGISNKNSYGVEYYNYLVNNLGDSMSDESGLINNEPNDIPIITDLLSAYLQGNKNSIATQKASAKFEGVAGVVGSGFGAVMGGMMMGGVGVAEGVTGMLSAGGRTHYQIQALNSKQQDIANTPPSIAKMGSNTSYTIGNGYDGIYIIKKQIKAEYRKKLTDFFKMFGYKVNELKTPNIHTRANFNFVKTVGANIIGDIPHETLAKIKSMFNNGVTLWHGDYVGDYSKDNIEL